MDFNFKGHKFCWSQTREEAKTLSCEGVCRLMEGQDVIRYFTLDIRPVAWRFKMC